MGKVRSATAALEAERDKLQAQHDKALAGLANVNDQSRALDDRRVSLLEVMQWTEREIGARTQAINLLNGGETSPVHMGIDDGEPTLMLDVEDDEPEEPKATSVRTLKKGEDPVKALEKLHAEDADLTPAKA